jgi:hypothetical protein
MSDANRPKQGRSWRDAGNRPASAPAASSDRGRKLFAAGALLATLVGLLIAMLLMLGGPPDVLVIAWGFDDYSSYQLRNPWASRDRQLLLSAAPWKRQPVDTATDLTLAAVRERVKNLPGLAGEVPVIVYLNALARLNDGKVIILVPDSKPDQPDSGLPLDELVSALAQCASKHKLLLLDLQRPLRQARLGLLGEDISSVIHQTLERLKPGGLHVLVSAGPLQESLVSDDMGHSVFAWYLSQGLRGSALTFDPQAANPDRVTVRGLIRYVHARVKNWSSNNRATKQEPWCWHSDDAESFELTSPSRQSLLASAAPMTATAEQTATASLATGTSPDSKPTEDPPAVATEKKLRTLLQQLWRELDAWRESGVGRAAGARLHFWHARALELEDRWRSGAPRDKLAAELEERLKQVQENRQQITDLLYRPRAASLAGALARVRFLHGDAAGLKPRGLDDAVREWASGNSEARKTIDESLKEAGAHKELLLAKAVLDAAADWRGLNRKRLESLLQLLPAAGTAEWAELLLVRDCLDERRAALLEDGRAVLDLVQPAIQLARAGEEMLAADPRLWPWLCRLVPLAEDQRHLALRLFYYRHDLPTEMMARQIDQARNTVANLLTLQTMLDEALRLRDLTLADLPSLAEMLAARPFTRGQEAQVQEQVRVWLELAAGLRKLDDDLQPPAAAAAPTDIETATRLITAVRDEARRLDARRRSLFAVLIDNVRSRLQAIHDNRTGGPADYGEVSALLLWTWLSARERDLLLEARQKLGSRLWQATLAQDRRVDSDSLNAPPVEAHRELPRFSAPSADDVRWNDAQALLHGRLAVGLLRLAGLSDEDVKDFDFDKPPSPLPPAWGPPLARLWRQALPARLERWRGELNRDADRLTRVLFQGRLAPWEAFTARDDNQVTLRTVKSDLDRRDQWLRRHYQELEAMWRGFERWSNYYGQAAPSSLAGSGAAGSSLRIELALPATVELRSDADDSVPAATVPVTLNWIGDSMAESLQGQQLRVEALCNNKWLQVKPAQQWEPAGSGKLQGEISVSGQPTIPDSSEREPEAFWLLVRTKERLWAFRQPISNLTGKLREPKLRLSATADGSAEVDPQGVELRTAAFTGQSLFVFVNNPGAKERSLRLRLMGAGGKVLRFLEFNLPPTRDYVPPPAVEKLYEPWPPDKTPLLDRDLTFELVDAATGKVISRRSVALRVAPATSLVRLERPTFQNNELSFDLTPRRLFSEQQPLLITLRVQPDADLPPERQPRPIIREEKLVGTARRSIKIPVEPRRRSGRGEAVIGIDGDPRVWLLHFYPADARAEWVTTRQVQILGPSCVPRGAEVEFTIATLNLGDGDYQWDLRSFGVEESAARPLRPARQVQYALAGGGPDNGLILSASMAEFRVKTKLPDDGRPQVTVRVVLSDRRGTIEDLKEITLADPLRLRADQVKASLAGEKLDKLELRFDPPPGLRVPIKTVKFLRADTKAELKETPLDLSEGEFRVWLPLPPKGTNLVVHVEVEDLAGQKENLLDIPVDVDRLRAEAARAELGRILVTVQRGGQRPGAGYRVVASQQQADGRWVVIKEETTDTTSTAVLRDLPAGVYWVSCQSSDGLKDGKSVTLGKRGEVTLTLELKR